MIPVRTNIKQLNNTFLVIKKSGKKITYYKNYSSVGTTSVNRAALFTLEQANAKIAHLQARGRKSKFQVVSAVEHFVNNWSLNLRHTYNNNGQPYEIVLENRSVPIDDVKTGKAILNNPTALFEKLVTELKTTVEANERERLSCLNKIKVLEETIKSITNKNVELSYAPEYKNIIANNIEQNSTNQDKVVSVLFAKGAI